MVGERLPYFQDMPEDLETQNPTNPQLNIENFTQYL